MCIFCPSARVLSFGFSWKNSDWPRIWRGPGAGVAGITSAITAPTRLWLASPHFYPTYGGAQNRYRQYIPGFTDRGLDVRLLTGTPLPEERSESDAQLAWYDVEPGKYLPPTVLSGVPRERIRLLAERRRAERRGEQLDDDDDVEVFYVD